MLPRRLSAPWLLLVAALALIVPPPPLLRAQSPPPPQGWTVARFAPLAERIRAGEAPDVLLLEGLPHQLVEHSAFLDERKAHKTTEIGGYHFYQPPLPLTAEEVAGLRATCLDPQTYGAYSGPKRCGGFHPDYALRWGHGRAAVYTLVCFGCHETQTLDGKRCLIADLPEPAFRRLEATLAKRRSQRPPYRKG